MKAALTLVIVLSMIGCAAGRHEPAVTPQVAPLATPQGEGPDVYGLRLGSPLHIAECGKLTLRGVTSYSAAKQAPCFQSLPAQERPADPKAPGASVLISFPAGAYPAQSAGGFITGLIVSGNLEGVVVSTGGSRDQDQVFDQLVAKYGRPTEAGRLPLTGSGPTFSGGRSGYWKTPEVEVLFSGIQGGAHRGFLRIATPKGAAEHEARLRALNSRRTAL